MNSYFFSILLDNSSDDLYNIVKDNGYILGGIMLNQLKNNYFFAVIRGKSSEDALEIAKHAILGGIRNIEVTFSTPEASKVIKQLSDDFKNNKEIIVGPERS